MIVWGTQPHEHVVHSISDVTKNDFSIWDRHHRLEITIIPLCNYYFFTSLRHGFSHNPLVPPQLINYNLNLQVEKFRPNLIYSVYVQNIFIMNMSLKQNKVKPVYSEHHMGLKFVAVIDRWSLLRGLFM